MGAEVHLACRSPDRGQKALDEIISKAQVTEKNVKLHILDVSKSDTVHTFVSDFTKQLNGKKIYALVNNAGCMVERAENAFGYEINFATNTLGMYILTKGFMEEQALGDGSRVVTVTSGGMLSHPLELDDMQWKKAGFDATKAYAKHKRQQVVITGNFIEIILKEVRAFKCIFRCLGEEVSINSISYDASWMVRYSCSERSNA